MLTENRIGVFICHKDKSESQNLNTDALKRLIHELPGVQAVEDLYQDRWETSAAQLSREVQAKNLSHLVIASCHTSNYESFFKQESRQFGLDPEKVSLVNIRPVYLGVEGETELIQERAGLLVKQAVGKKFRDEPVDQEILETVPRILVLGSDLVGLTAARQALSLGYEVLVLDEKEPLGSAGFHGGFIEDQGKKAWEELLQHPKVSAVTGAHLAGFSGKAGSFEVFFQDHEERLHRQEVGAVLIALPSQEVPAFNRYGLKPGRRILSLSQLETLLASPAYQEKMFPSGKDTEATFLLGLGFESYPGVVERVLKNARILQQLPSTQVHVLTGNMKVAGPGLERAFTQAREEGILFFRCDHDRPLFKDSESGLQIEFRDDIIDRVLTLQPQVLIVDEFLAPHPNLKAIAGHLEIPLDAAGFLSPDQVYALPNRTPRKGIFAAGGSRRPVSETPDLLSEVEEALLSAVELIGKGQQTVEAPRVEVDRKKCTICLTCVRSCPHQAITFSYRRPQISPLACQVCGICAAECPMDAIQIKNFRDQGIREEISSFFKDRKYDVLAPQVVVFCCKNSADKTVRQALLFREPLPIGFDFIQVPCAGRLDPDYVLHALREGADAVLILACPIEACKSFEGNRKAYERVQFLQDRVPDLGLEPERILFETVAPGMVSQLKTLLGELEIRIHALGISPVRRSRGIQKIYNKFTVSVDNKLFIINP